MGDTVPHRAQPPPSRARADLTHRRGSEDDREAIRPDLPEDHPRNGGPRLRKVRYIHTIIYKALEDAVDAGVLAKNVAERAKAPRPSRCATGKVGSWESHELAQFLGSVTDERLQAVWRLAAMTGMRSGEVLGLRWADMRPRRCPAIRTPGRRRRGVRGHRVDPEESQRSRDRPRQRDRRAAPDPSSAATRGTRRVGRGLRERRLGRCQGERHIHPHSFSQTFERLVKATSA
jgi:integrase